jgi:Sec-independent protein translocase protein TatA
MDSFFGIGAPELIFILILAGLVLGPHRIRQVAFWLGKTTAQLQTISRGFMAQLNKELDSVDSGELREAMKEVQDLRGQMAELRHEITHSMSNPMQEAQAALDEGKDALNQTILPPSLSTKQDETGTNGNGPLQLPKPVKVTDDPE